MPIRVYRLARDLGIGNDSMRAHCRAAGIGDKSPLSSLTDEEQTRLRAYLAVRARTAGSPLAEPAADPATLLVSPVPGGVSKTGRLQTAGELLRRVETIGSPSDDFEESVEERCIVAPRVIDSPYGEVLEFARREPLGNLRVPRRIANRYEIDGVLSDQGGFGIIYTARDLGLKKRRVLVKARRYSPDFFFYRDDASRARSGLKKSGNRPVSNWIVYFCSAIGRRIGSPRFTIFGRASPP